MKSSRLKSAVGSGQKPLSSAGVLAAAILASAFALPAWAGRPLATEDAGVLGQGTCEIESYAGRAGGGDSVHTRWAQFGCGVGGATQLAFGAGAEKAEGETSTVAALSGKTFLRELTDDQAGWVLAYALLGVREPGSGFRHNATELKAVLTVPRGAWLVHANLGTQYAHAERTYTTTWGLAAERPGAIGPVDLMAEVFGDDRTAPWIQVGARWTVVPERFYLDASWGAQTGDERARQVTVGLKIAF
jgi:hypothetical protein